jgi:hypothetical protein
MPMNREVTGNYKAMVDAGKEKNVTVMEIPGRHNTSWVNAVRGSGPAINREIIEDIVNAFSQKHPEFFTEQENYFTRCALEVCDYMGKLDSKERENVLLEPLLEGIANKYFYINEGDEGDIALVKKFVDQFLSYI